MDAPVVAALISSSVAVFVAAAGTLRAELVRGSDRRYERRRVFLVDAQDAALALRDALRTYGDALRHTAAEHGPATGPLRPADTAPLDAAVATADGRLAVAISRVEDVQVVAAVARWLRLARVGLIDEFETGAASEQAAFDAINEAIAAALRSRLGRARR